MALKVPGPAGSRPASLTKGYLLGNSADDAACAVLEAATVRLLADQLVARKLASRREIAAHFEAVAGGRLDLTTAPLVSAWGRRA